LSNASVLNIVALDVKERLLAGEKLQIIDVREAQEVATGKIPGAKHIPLGEIPNRIDEINPNIETIMVCYSGGRSAAACEYLMNQGFKHVKNMLGGMSGWQGNVE